MSFKFSNFTVTKQVFYSTKLSFALVNLKPILPGHVLVCPRRQIGRLTELRSEEVADLFQTAQLVARAVEQYYDGRGLNIAVQDGPVAGQSVNHVHCHVIPRQIKDLKYADQLYELLNEHDVNEVFSQVRKTALEGTELVPDEDRKPRSMEQMETEATKLREFIEAHYEELSSENYRSK